MTNYLTGSQKTSHDLYSVYLPRFSQQELQIIVYNCIIDIIELRINLQTVVIVVWPVVIMPIKWLLPDVVPNKHHAHKCTV